MNRCSLILLLVALPLFSQSNSTSLRGSKRVIAEGMPVEPTLTSGQAYFVMTTMLAGALSFAAGIWKCQGTFTRDVARDLPEMGQGFIQNRNGPLTIQSFHRGIVASRFIFLGSLLILSSTLGTVFFETPDPY